MGGGGGGHGPLWILPGQQLFYCMIFFLTDEARILAWKRVLLTKPSTIFFKFLLELNNKMQVELVLKQVHFVTSFFIYLYFLFKFHSILT